MATRTQAQAPARYEIWNVHSNHVSLVVNMRDHYAIPFTVKSARRREVGNDRSGSPHDCRRRSGIEYGKLEAYLLSEIEAP
ncbi:MAG UNVERIFIED_CONTAM: hypothetical protein LVR18_13415 [Planctomycetaceae bacterium]|jgi:hypothetical protein